MKKRQSFTMCVSDELLEKLNQLRKEEFSGASKAQTVRMLIEDAVKKLREVKGV